MNLDTLPSHLSLVSTDDGSPSMEIKYDTVSEWMHSSHGAFEESKYIYLQALERVHSLDIPVRILSVGLGLGYNEILSVGFALKHGLSLEIQSYENEEFLVESFRRWSLGESGNTEVMPSVYEKILNLTATHFELDPGRLKSSLLDLCRDQKLNHLGALTITGPFPSGQTLIYFDPFSNKASPDFWTPEFIKTFLIQCSAPQCVLSTYAATGNLKRELKEQGFHVDLRPGFAGKRHSIFAVRSSSSL